MKNPGVYYINKTSSRVRLNSLGPSHDLADTTNWAGPTPSSTFCYGELLFEGPGCVTNMLNKLQWDPLQHRRAKSKVIMLYKIIHQEVDIPFQHPLVTNTRVTRGTQANYIRQISTRVDAYKFSFVPSTFTAWNRLPSDQKLALTRQWTASGRRSRTWSLSTSPDIRPSCILPFLACT